MSKPKETAMAAQETYQILETFSLALREWNPTLRKHSDIAIVKGQSDRLLDLLYKDAERGYRYDIVKVNRYAVYLAPADIASLKDGKRIGEFSRIDAAQTVCDALNANGGKDVQYHCMMNAPVEFIEKDGVFLAVPNKGATAQELRDAAQAIRDEAPKFKEWNAQFNARVLSALIDMLADGVTDETATVTKAMRDARRAEDARLAQDGIVQVHGFGKSPI
jgi:hypothetical protein